tara:strand:- start:428 stop:1153 length:726 start_codon:yes stop_codon:yes gene_type:complete
MSYNGTVRCSFCHGTGHNRRSCPELKKYCEENPDSDWAKFETHRKARKNKKRCGFCGETGHNKRTCPQLAELKQLWKQYVPLAQELSNEIAARLGYGFGHVIQRGDHPAVCVGMEAKPVCPAWIDRPQNPVSSFIEEPKFVYVDPRGVKDKGWCPTPNNTAIKESIANAITQDEGQRDKVKHHLGYWGYSGSKEKALSFVSFSAERVKTFGDLPANREIKPANVQFSIESVTKILKQMKNA